MSDLIDREDAIKDAESWVAVDEYEKHLQKNVVEWLKEFPPAELSTNLAEVGTDCISKQQAIDAVRMVIGDNRSISVCDAIKQLPPIQPKRGRWHYSDGKPARIGLSFGVVCDQCGTESEYCTNFCGECGADMRKKEVNIESN